MTSPSGSTTDEAKLSRRASRDRGVRHRADRRQRRRPRQDHPPARTDEPLRGRPASADLDPRPRHHRRGRARDRPDLGFGRRRPARLADPRHAEAAARHTAGARPGADVDVPARRHADDLRSAPCAGAAGRDAARQRACIRPAPSSSNSSCSPTSATPTAACSRRARCSTAARSGKTEVYSVDHLHGMEPLFSDIYAAAQAAGHSGRDGDLRICARPVRTDAATTART